MRYLLLILSLLPILATSANAATEVYTSRIEGDQIALNAFFNVYDGKYNTMLVNYSTWTTQFSNLAVRNRIRLGLNPEYVQSAAVGGTIDLIVTKYVWNGGGFTATDIPVSLAVTYSATGTAVIDELATFSFTDAHRIKVRVAGLPTGYNVNAIYIQSEIEIERVYKYQPAVVPAATITTDGEFLQFNWTPVIGAESYEIEFVHINNYKVSSESDAFTAAELEYNYYRNSTRLAVNSSSYRIQNIYDKGYIMFRIRTIGLSPNGKFRREGAWSAPESGTIASHPAQQKLQITEEYDEHMNWSHVVGYAENGRRAEMVAFADGLGRTHQGVAHKTVTGQTIVNNKYYDRVGRAVVGDLPTPVNSSVMEHHFNFNQAVGDNNYDYTNFENYSVQQPGCVQPAAGFSTTGGAGRYYSSANPDKTDENSRIPDAQSYPFMRILYRNDFTGRVNRVGAYGTDFKVGSGHDKEYRYGVPSQEELDAMLGTEAGYADHYQKMTTIDANGQAYVQYFDMAGRIVASGMTGSAPSNLFEIGQAAPSTQTQTISEGLNPTVTPSSMTLETSLDVFTTADYTFDYKLNPATFSSPCAPNICLDCKYILNIAIEDEDCGEIIYENTLPINGAAYDALCNGTSNFANTFVVNLQPNNYKLIKTLTIDESAIDAYWCSYIEDYNCSPSLTEIFNTLYAATEFDCQDDDTEAEEAAAEDCDTRREIMLSDMSPGGQYGEWTASGAAYVATSPISVFNLSNSLGSDYKDVVWGGYRDENNAIDYVEVTLVSPGVYSPAITGSPVGAQLPNGNYRVYPQQLANLRDFIDAFEPSWAVALLPYHPEYCYLQFCESPAAQASQDFDRQMKEIKEHSAACQGGYYKPLGSLYYVGTNAALNSCPATYLDPFFQSLPGSNYMAAMTDKVDNYINIGGSDFSMLDYAIVSVVCPDVTTSAEAGVCIRNADFNCYGDLIWLAFVEMYQFEKSRFYAQAEAAGVSCAIPHGTIGNGNSSNPFGNAVPRWGQLQEMLDEDYSLPGNDPMLDVDATAAAVCQSTCEGYADDWLSSLGGCSLIANLQSTNPTAFANLREDLISLCSYGCNADHPAGATTLPATISPSPLALNGGNVTGGASINDVLALYFPGFTESDLCTELLIDGAQPYHEELIPQYELDKCGCDIVLNGELGFNGGAGLPTGTTIEDYIYSTTGITLADANGYICICMKALFSPWAPGHTWTQNETDVLATIAPAVPEELSCPAACLGCEVAQDLLEDLELRFGPDLSTSQNYGTIVANYFNAQLNYTLGAEDYLDFLNKCSGEEGNPYCEVSEEALSWLDVMDLIAHRGQLLNGASSAVDLAAQNIVYTQSPLAVSTAQTHYAALQNGEVLNTYFTNSSGSDLSCGVSLDLNGAPFGFEDIVSFAGIEPGEPDCDPANTFRVTVAYIDCGKLQYGELQAESSCFEVLDCYCGGPLTLCNAAPSDQYLNDQPCYEPRLSELYELALGQYEANINEIRQQFEAAYLDKCNDAFSTELIKWTGPFSKYQFTLFFYDQAGNLVRTVAPKGVTPLADNSAVKVSRDGTTGIDDQETPVMPLHSYNTQYAYNSYDQLVETSNPDHDAVGADLKGITRYWYDRYGRIIASQNPQQKFDNRYSYVFYDALGRPVETGQVVKTGAFPEASAKLPDLGAAFRQWVMFTGATDNVRTEVTLTQYDSEFMNFTSKFRTGRQQNLRLRVASVLYCNTLRDNDIIYEVYRHAVHYSYDLHGNVIESVQDIGNASEFSDFIASEQLSKSTVYEFELLSGNVKKAHFQKGSPDQFTHRYVYDRLNRLTEVFTSNDGGIHESREAHYRYFDYGPLARIELGKHKVQGTDFSYTINGWLKGANSNSLKEQNDGGMDGATGNLMGSNSFNQLTAKDVTGYTLGYYMGDYAPIGPASFESPVGSGNVLSNAIRNLYNGNIAWTVTSISTFQPQAAVYRYDQLQRLRQMDVFRSSNNLTGNTWSGTATSTTQYQSQYTYDKNGNLATLNRYGLSVMDAFSYNYTTVNSQPSNRLTHVDDAYSTTGVSEDMEDQAPGNYTYNRIGQIKSDALAGIQEIVWRNGDKKVQRVLRNDQGSDELEFEYNPFGQRVLKIAKPRISGVVQANTTWEYTYYAYDANGNVISTYVLKPYATTKAVNVIEQTIYGAARLGISAEAAGGREIWNASTGVPTFGATRYSKLGLKRYELTNYLGNVNAVINDRKTPVAAAEYFLRFNGTNQYGSTSSYNPALTSNTNFTVELWMRSTQSTGTGTLFFHGNTTSNIALNLVNGKVRVDGLQSSAAKTSNASATTVTDGQWHHIAGVASGTTWKIYVDGVLESSNSLNSVGTFSFTSSALVGRNNAGTITYYKGDLKKVSYWKIDRTGAQILADMSVQLTGSETNLLNYWPMTASSGNPSPDVTTNITPKPMTLFNSVASASEQRYEAVVLMRADYYPFGMVMPGRHVNDNTYRYGYNGMERDDEIRGDANSYTTEFRQYDPRIGRWLSLDPLMKRFPWMSPYVAFNNNPIYYVDPFGLEGDPPGCTPAEPEVGYTCYEETSDEIWYYKGDGEWGTLLEGATARELVDLHRRLYTLEQDMQSIGQLELDNATLIELNNALEKQVRLLEEKNSILKKLNEMRETQVRIAHTLVWMDHYFEQKKSSVENDGWFDLNYEVDYNSGIATYGEIRDLYIDEPTTYVPSANPIPPSQMASGAAQPCDWFWTLFIAPWRAGGVAVTEAVVVKTTAVEVVEQTVIHFSRQAIDDAVVYAVENKSIHVFGKAAHNLSGYLTTMGGEEAAFRGVVNALSGRLTSSGVFETTVSVSGYNITVRGFLSNGIPKIGTMFIP
jgi:RHS repeat-associated protein